jgi:hypothetical protein
VVEQILQLKKVIIAAWTTFSFTGTYRYFMEIMKFFCRSVHHDLFKYIEIIPPHISSGYHYFPSSKLTWRHFRKMKEVLNGYVTNPTPTLTLTELMKKSKKKRL